jgi:hypothetical protein
MYDAGKKLKQGFLSYSIQLKDERTFECQVCNMGLFFRKVSGTGPRGQNCIMDGAVSLLGCNFVWTLQPWRWRSMFFHNIGIYLLHMALETRKKYCINNYLLCCPYLCVSVVIVIFPSPILEAPRQ